MKRFIAFLTIVATLSMTTACSTHNYTEQVTGPYGHVWTVNRTQTFDETGRYLGQGLAIAIPVVLGALAWRHW